jgi:hypothetical protein
VKLMQLMATLTPGRAVTVLTMLNLLMLYQASKGRRSVVTRSAPDGSEAVRLWAIGTLTILVWVACVILLHGYDLD